MSLTGLPVVEGQDLERGGPASADEAERAAGHRRAAGVHTATARHRYATTHTAALSLFVCLSVRPEPRSLRRPSTRTHSSIPGLKAGVHARVRPF